MRMIYIDADYKCHVTDDGAMRAFEMKEFDGKCDAYIEGYRYIPYGESWVREDGAVFCGEMLCPWRSYSELDAVQRAYEKARLLEAETVMNELIGGVKDVQQE